MFHHISLDDHERMAEGVCDMPKVDFRPEDLAKLDGFAKAYRSISCEMENGIDAYKVEAKLKLDYYAILRLALEHVTEDEGKAE